MGFINYIWQCFINCQVIMLLLLYTDKEVLSFSTTVELLQDGYKTNDESRYVSHPQLINKYYAVDEPVELTNTDSLKFPISDGGITLNAEDFKENEGIKESKKTFVSSRLNKDNYGKSNKNEVSVSKNVKYQNVDDKQHDESHTSRLAKIKSSQRNSDMDSVIKSEKIPMIQKHTENPHMSNEENLQLNVVNNVMHNLMPDILRIFSPKFSSFTDKVVQDTKLNENSHNLQNTQEFNRKINKEENLDENSDYIIENKLAQNKIFKNLEMLDNNSRKNILLSNFRNDNETLMNRLLAIKTFIDRISSEHDNSSISFKEKKQKNFDSMSNGHFGKPEKYFDFINEFEQMLQEMFGGIMKKSLYNDLNFNSKQENINNSENCDSNVKKQNLLHNDGLRYLNGNKSHNIYHLFKNNSLDKYFSHNLAQMSNDRKDKEYPIDVLHLFSYIN